MKIIINLNRDVQALEMLLKSLEDNIIGEYEYFILDSNSLIKQDDVRFKNVIVAFDLKYTLLSIIGNDPKEYYTIIDETKYCYDKVDISAIKKEMSDEEIFCFSLSLGKNITYCGNMECDNVFVPEKEENGIVYWDWSVHYFDFGYPLNLDGSVFRGKELLKFIKNIQFKDTLELESALQVFDNYPKTKMCSFEKNKFVELNFENTKNRINFKIDSLNIDRVKFHIKSEKSEEINESTSQIPNQSTS